MSKNMFRILTRNFGSINEYILQIRSSTNEFVFDRSHPDKIAFIGLNRPKSKNSLGINLFKEFKAALNTLSNDSDSRCLVIGSLVPNLFCAGADLKERACMKEEEVGPFVKKARQLFQEITDLPIPTICAIDGPALGGGLEMALACDLRYTTVDSLMGLVETRLGIIPGAGGTQRLPRLVGVSVAKELMFRGSKLNGKEACEIGLVNGAVEQNADGLAALNKAFEVAKEISSLTGPIAVRMIKMAIDEGMKCGVTVTQDALEVEEKSYHRVIKTRDRLEGLSAFKEKRKPNFEGK